MYIYELMMTEWSQCVIIMGSKYSKVGIWHAACAPSDAKLLEGGVYVFRNRVRP